MYIIYLVKSAFPQAVSYTHLDVYKRQLLEGRMRAAAPISPVSSSQAKSTSSTACHGWGHCVDIKPEQEMEKVLFAVDELLSLIHI